MRGLPKDVGATLFGTAPSLKPKRKPNTDRVATTAVSPSTRSSGWTIERSIG
jgi:hypothetical protein